MYGKVRDFAEIVSRYVGITMTYAHASVLRDASGLFGVRGSVRRASYGHPELLARQLYHTAVEPADP